jgi:hypothetical protein
MHATAAKHPGGPGCQIHDFHAASLATSASEKPHGTKFDPRRKKCSGFIDFSGRNGR